MLHSEARELLVQGYEAAHDAKGIAKAYSVSKWTVYRPAEQKRKAGSVALRTSQRGRKPVLAAEDKENIQHCMDEIPDVTIEEIREKLNLSASYSIVDRAIAAMGYTVKKKSLCASERVRCAGKEQRMESDHCKENKDKRVEARLKALELRSKGAKAHEVAAAGFHAAYVTQLVAKYRNNGLRVCLKSFDKREREADNREKQAGVGENASISK